MTEALDPRERRRRGDNALETVRREYGWDSVIDRYRELYDRVSRRG